MDTQGDDAVSRFAREGIATRLLYARSTMRSIAGRGARALAQLWDMHQRRRVRVHLFSMGRSKQ